MAKEEAENLNYLRKENLSLFTTNSLERGKRYYLETRVELTYQDESKGEFHANVKGSHLYAVRIDFQNDLIKKASCNCLYSGAGYCKHIAATLFALQREQNKKSGNPELSLYEKIQKYGSASVSNRSIVSYLNASFGEIKKAWEAKEIEENEIPYLLKRVYEVAHDYFFIENSYIGEDATKRICQFNLSKETFYLIYDFLFSVLFGEGKDSFFLSSIKSDCLKEAALEHLLRAMEDKNYYSYRPALFSSERRKSVLVAFKNDDLKRLLSTRFDFLFSPKEIMDEIVKRNEYSLLPSLLNNLNYNCDASFLLSLGELFIRQHMEKEGQEAYRRMLFSRGLTLKEFLVYFRSFRPEEIAKQSESLLRIATLRGFENAYFFLANGDSSMIKKFNLSDFDSLYQEILERGIPYEDFLLKRIDNALNRVKFSYSSLESILRIFKNYPKTIVMNFMNNPDLYRVLNDEDFATLFSILHEKGLLESAGFLSWRK